MQANSSVLLLPPRESFRTLVSCSSSNSSDSTGVTANDNPVVVGSSGQSQLPARRKLVSTYYDALGHVQQGASCSVPPHTAQDNSNSD
eukprot:5475-Heterococcus_DN1.PRE.6